MFKKYFSSRLVIVLFITLYFCISVQGAAKEKNEWIDPILKSPFYVPLIEIAPGSKFFLHAKLPLVKDLEDDKYNLVLDLPGQMALTDLKPAGTDISHYNLRVDPIIEKTEAYTKKGEKRLKLTYKPDMSNLCEGIELNFSYKRKQGDTISYTPIFKFLKSFEWKHYQKQVLTPSHANSVVPFILKWPFNSTYQGKLFLRSLAITEVDTEDTIFQQEWKQPIIVEAKKGIKSAFRIGIIKIKPGKLYNVSCEVKGEDIRSNNMSAKTAMGKTPFYTRVFIFDVEKKIDLPNKLHWKITNDQGRVYREGEVKLLKKGETLHPKKLETSVWIAETRLEGESPSVQEAYINKFYEWGLTTILPTINGQKFETPLKELQLDIPIAHLAKQKGMFVRPYMHFLVIGDDARSYCQKHPQNQGRTYKGDKLSDSRVCITYALDGTKYDSSGPQVKGGRENPWLRHNLKIIEMYVKQNRLDGIWFDHEYRGSPYRKVKPDPYKNNYRQTCWCSRCIRAFKDYAKLDHVPTIEECCENYYEKVVDFRCWQHIRLWRLLRETAREVNPRATFGIYSGSPSMGKSMGGKPGDYCRQSYGVDWRMAAPYLDIAMIRVFEPNDKHANYWQKTLSEGLKEGEPLPKTIISLYGPSASKGYDRVYRLYAQLKNNIIKLVAFHQSWGWTFCRICGLDDQLTRSIREANNLIVKYEDFFLKGKKINNVKVEGKKVETATWQLKDKQITFLLNYQLEPQTVVLQHSTGLKSKQIQVLANDVAVYEW